MGGRVIEAGGAASWGSSPGNGRRWVVLLITAISSSCSGPGGFRFPGSEPVTGIAFVSERDGNREIYLIQHFDDLPGEQYAMGWSPDGRTLAFSSLCEDDTARIYLWDRDTRQVTPLTPKGANANHPAFSPDGRLLAFAASLDGPVDIFVMNLSTGEIRNLTRNEAPDNHPTWSPDGAHIAFTSRRDGNDEIYVMSADGADPRNLTQHPAPDFLPAWSPTGPP